MRRGIAATLAALAAASLAGAPTWAATAPSTAPQVRVVQDMHTAAIDQVRADARFERLVTISRDKTLRIWRLADLRPLRSVALPAEPGPEGTPYAVAVSADGTQIFAGGYTGFDWQKASHIYRIDGDTGRITGTLGSFDGDVVTALDPSPDGTRLAVGLGRGGLVVLDVVTGMRLFADPQYAAPVSFAHHAPDGRLATSSADGCLRVYARDGALIHRHQYPPTPAHEPQCTGGELGGVRFSPDGRWIALGIRSRPEVYLLDAARVALQRTLRVTDADQLSLCCVAWAPDGHTLWVNGTIEGDRPTPLYRVRDPATASPERLDAGRQQFTNMLPMPDGTLVFATTVPSLTRIGADGLVARRTDGAPLIATPDNIDFHRTRNAPETFRLGADGRALLLEASPGRWWRADPQSPDPDRVRTDADPGSPGFVSAYRSGALSVQTSTGVSAHRDPTLVNGQPVALGFEEGVRSWAVHPRVRIAAFGTQWRLHLVDERGRPMPGWEQPPFLGAPAYHTVISEDARWVVVALGDGTVHWYDVASGKPRLSMFVHVGGRDWVAWRPDGYYASSPRGDSFIGWLINRGAAQSPDFVRAVQFERTLYRPDLVRASLAAAQGSAPALGALLADLAPPRVVIESIQRLDGASLSIRFSAEATGRPITEIGVFVDGIPALRAFERKVSGAAAQRLTRTVNVPIAPGQQHVRVEAESVRALGADESSALRPPPASASGRAGTLWLVAAGVQRFDRVPQLRPLPYATNDAHGLARAFAQQAGKAFGAVHATVLSESSDTKPTKARLMAALRELDQMQAEDTAVVFIASHGTTDAAEYYVMTKDADPADVRKLVQAQDTTPRLAPTELPSLLSGREIMDALRRLPGRRILMLDTCQAGALGNSNPYSLVKRSASAQLAVMSAARGDEASYDSPSQPHGAFTHAVIRALTERTPLRHGAVRSVTAFDAAVPEVQQVVRALREKTRGSSDGEAIRQTPVLLTPPVLESTILAIL